MNSIKTIAIALIIGGLLALTYGGFSYTKETHVANIGPIHMEVDEKQRVNIPLWAGVVAVIAGVVLLGSAARKS